MVPCLGSLFSRCGEGGAPRTNVTGVCGSAAVSRPRWVCPRSREWAFSGYTAQAPGCSAGNCLRQALGCVHSPGLSGSGSGSPQRRRLGWACVLCPSQVRAAQGTRCLAGAVAPSWGLHLLASPIPATGFSGCTTSVPSQLCPVSLLGSVQNPKKSWLARLAVW